MATGQIADAECYNMKILAAVLFWLGLIFLSSKTYVEGRRLQVASRFTGKSNNQEKEHPLKYNDTKVGIDHTVQKEKDVVNQKTSYGDGTAASEIDRNLSNDAKYRKNDDDDSDDDDSDDNDPNDDYFDDNDPGDYTADHLHTSNRNEYNCRRVGFRPGIPPCREH